MDCLEYLFNFCCCYNFPIGENDYGNMRRNTSNDPILIHEIYSNNQIKR